jgi:single-strand DNA-binding protein
VAAYNKVILMGNLTRDPELRYTPEGVALCKFDMAVNSSYRRGEEGNEDTLFIGIVSWNKTAETAGQFLKKGRAVLVDGRLKSSSWETEDGSKRYRTEVVASVIQFLPKGSERDVNGAAQERESTREVDSKPIDDIPDDEIPF